MTVQERLTDGGRNFTPSEIKVVRQLLANYPVSGLTTISGLAKRSHVSDPTVVRLAYKLGFDGFAAMQEQLLAEVEAHLNSPLTILAGKRKKGAHTDLLRHFLDDMAGAVRSAADEIVRPHFNRPPIFWPIGASEYSASVAASAVTLPQSCAGTCSSFDPLSRC